MRAAIEEELERFFVQMQELREGDLEHLEEQVVKTSQQMGRSLLEGLLDSQLREQRPVARRQGRCGHRQRLVGERPKQLLTLLGPVTFVRPARITNVWMRAVAMAKRPMTPYGESNRNGRPAECHGRSAICVDA